MVRHWLKERARQRTAKPEPEDSTRLGAAYDDKRPLPDVELAVEGKSHFVSDEVTASGNWRKSIVINGVGALATAVVLAVFIMTKFMHGAWIVVVVTPLLVLMFRAIHAHYLSVARQLSMDGLEPLHTVNHRVIVPISGIHRGAVNALEYARSIASGNVTAVYVDFDEETTAKLREKWEQWGTGVELVILPSPYRELTGPLLRYIHRLDRKREGDIITVVIPEFVPAKWWQHLLHNQSSLLLKGALLFKEGVIVTNVPYHLKH